MTREQRWPGSAITIPAPRTAVAWAAETGFIYDPDKAQALIDDGRLVFHVSQPEPTADPDQPGGEPFVNGITGTPPVHAVIRIDRDIAHLRGRVEHLVRFAEETRRYVEDFHGRVIDVAEEAVQASAPHWTDRVQASAPAVLTGPSSRCTTGLTVVDR